MQQHWQAMRPALERVPAIATRASSKAPARNPPRLPTKPSTAPWVCERCLHGSQRRFLSTPSKRPRSPLETPITRSLNLTNLPNRFLSSSSCLRDGAKPRDDLPSQEEGRRSHASKRFDHLMDNLQSNIFIAGQRLNDLTGYSGIEALKKDIEQQGRSQALPFCQFIT